MSTCQKLTQFESGAAMILKHNAGKSEFTKLREQAGLTLPEAEALLKVDRRTVYRYERGETKPSKLARDILRQAAGKRIAQDGAPPSFRFIDLFAGIGGLRLGFEPAGGRCVFTSEWDLTGWRQSPRMVDVVSPAERSRMMAGIKGKNTKPETGLPFPYGKAWCDRPGRSPKPASRSACVEARIYPVPPLPFRPSVVSQRTSRSRSARRSRA
jgi:transcriptional regulator with XRE-family HTH domain